MSRRVTLTDLSEDETFVTEQGDRSSKQPPSAGVGPRAIVTAVAIAVGLLVKGELEALMRIDCAHRMTAEDLQRRITEFGATLVMPPDSFWSTLDIVTTNAVPPAYDVSVRMWTAEEGESDLTLELGLREVVGLHVYDTAVLDLHIR
jgi:hypothetical protein